MLFSHIHPENVMSIYEKRTEKFRSRFGVTQIARGRPSPILQGGACRVLRGTGQGDRTRSNRTYTIINVYMSPFAAANNVICPVFTRDSPSRHSKLFVDSVAVSAIILFVSIPSKRLYQSVLLGFRSIRIIWSMRMDSVFDLYEG